MTNRRASAGADKAVGNVMQWATQEDWADAWGAVLADHIVPVCEDLGIAPVSRSTTTGTVSPAESTNSFSPAPCFCRIVTGKRAAQPR